MDVEHGGRWGSQGLSAICAQEDVRIVGATRSQGFAWAESETVGLHG